VEENPQKVINLLVKITKKPKIIQRFQKFIKKEKENNINAGENLIKTTLDFLKKEAN